MKRTARTLLQHNSLEVPKTEAPANAVVGVARMPRSKDFGRVWLAALTGDSRTALFSTKARLYLYLWIVTREGSRCPVRLTTEMAAELGLSNTNKMRELRRLEALGLIALRLLPSRVVEVTAVWRA